MNKLQQRIQYCTVLMIIASLSLLLVACGLPSFSQAPNPPNLIGTGINTIAVDIPANSANTTGIVVLYKILADPIETQYETEYNSLRNEDNGNLAYRALERQGYTPVLVDGSDIAPTINFANYPAIFTENVLANGLTSSSLSASRGRGIDIRLRDPSGLEIVLKENIGTVQVVPVKRNSGITGNREFFPISSSYNSEDTDLQHLSSEIRSDISTRSLRLSLAVFTYAARRTFDEDDQYSVPYIMDWTELFEM